MKKTVLGVVALTVLSGCDNVDITKYPVAVQECYNGIIYNNDNCTKSKKTIIKYCECSQGVQGQIEAKALEARQGAVAAATLFGGAFGGLAGVGAAVQAQAVVNSYAQELYNECAEKTGYTRVSVCQERAAAKAAKEAAKEAEKEVAKEAEKVEEKPAESESKDAKSNETKKDGE